MRLSHAALVLASLVAAAPAMAQNDSPGTHGAIRYIDDAVNHNDRDDRDRDHSGSTVPPRDLQDNHEKRQLDEHQKQLDNAQERLNEQKRERESQRNHDDPHHDRDDSR